MQTLSDKRHQNLPSVPPASSRSRSAQISPLPSPQTEEAFRHLDRDLSSLAQRNVQLEAALKARDREAERLGKAVEAARAAEATACAGTAAAEDAAKRVQGQGVCLGRGQGDPQPSPQLASHGAAPPLTLLFANYSAAQASSLSQRAFHTSHISHTSHTSHTLRRARFFPPARLPARGGAQGHKGEGRREASEGGRAGRGSAGRGDGHEDPGRANRSSRI